MLEDILRLISGKLSIRRTNLSPAAGIGAVTAPAVQLTAVSLPRAGRGRDRFRSLLLLLMVACSLLAVVSLSAHAAGDGYKIYKELKSNGGLYDDPEWNAYVRGIAARIIETNDIKGEYHFNIIDDANFNAFATRDGYIFVHRGLLTSLNSEGELAGILGHEIGHVVGRHVQRRNRVTRVGRVAGILGSIFTGTGAINDLANATTATISSGFGRELELEADGYGGDFLARAGYNPMSMIDGIQVLKDSELYEKSKPNGKPRYHGLFTTHPKNDKRLHELVLKNQHLMPDELAEPVGDFWDLMDGLVYGDESSTGLVKKDTYYHSVLRIVVKFPLGWNITNNGKEIGADAPAGKKEGLITLQRQGGGKAKTPKDYLVDTLKRNDLTNGEDLTVNSYPAHIAEVPVTGSDAKLRMIATILKDAEFYLLKAEAGPDGDPEIVRKQFRATVESFRGMTSADARIANGQTVTVIVAEPGMTYRELAKKSSIKRDAEGILRVINGDHPYGEPTAGDYLKIVQ